MRPYSRIASLIFAVVCIAHLLRVITGSAITVGLYIIPMAVSYIGIVVAGLLSYGLWKESKRKRH